MKAEYLFRQGGKSNVPVVYVSTCSVYFSWGKTLLSLTIK